MSAFKKVYLIFAFGVLGIYSLSAISGCDPPSFAGGGSGGSGYRSYGGYGGK